MTDTTSANPPSPAPSTAAPPPPPPVDPAPARSKAWLGGLVAFVAVALVAGATAVLFVRVQEAQDRADEAVVLAGNQDASQEALEARLDSLDAALADLESSGSTTSGDVESVRGQVAALRRCVNSALDSFASATQAGRPVSITKC